ncbi:MAG: hypothetical protein K6C97_02490 [Treponema sp.]|nr:hypothetical protein [Treponema sp.]
MKKGLLLLVLLSLSLSLFAMEIPQELYGIWEGKDRFVFFEENKDEESPQIVILLKEYYGWYYDRAAEPQEYADKENRVRNTGTTRKAEQVYFSINSISKADPERRDAFELNMKYSKFQNSIIPLAIIDDNIFLNFYIQDTENKNLYRGNAVSLGIMLSPQKVPQNIGAFYIDQDKVFNIRYWFTDMDYVDDLVSLKYGDKEYFVDKHLYSCGNNYSSVSGRSKKIRNVVAPEEYKEESYKFNSDKSIMILDKEPYLTRLADKSTFEDLMKIVKEGNARRKPDPKPLFPPDDLNWHWDLIDYLESNNTLIQAVRARQRAFGPRPKDLNK